MGIGTSIRHRLGRFEHPVAERYRSYFIALDDVAEVLATVVTPGSFLEIGCGDGSMANAMHRAIPAAKLTGIDLAPEPGRRFQGNPDQVAFRSTPAETLLDEAERFSLVLLCDVLHHVPAPDRLGLVRTAAALLEPGGLVAIKDWERSRTLAHFLTYTSDRFVSGDASVDFFPPGGVDHLLEAALPHANCVVRARIPPHRNNVLIVVRPSNEPGGAMR